ncbi:MAG: flagella synthesis protein FlgN [Gammaproteobacteria bacterium]
MKPREFAGLTEIFRVTLDELTVLEDLLEQESRALAERRVDEIQILTEKKKESVTRLQELATRQNRFFESHELPDGEIGLGLFLERFEETDPERIVLQGQLSNIQKSVEKCKGLNERNGARIGLMSSHTRRAMEILRSADNPVDTYGPDGASRQTSLSRPGITV